MQRKPNSAATGQFDCRAERGSNHKLHDSQSPLNQALCEKTEVSVIIKIEPKFAGNILIGVCSGLIIFHVVNMLGLIPLNITWLGRVNADRTMLIMGLLSILINCVIILCALVKCNYLNNTFLNKNIERVLPFVFWWLVGNTVANLFSKTTFEVVVFTPILVVLSYCFYIIKTKAGQ